MTTFLVNACSDMRCGRCSWRVYLALGAPALAAGILLGTLG